jgi:hypothetical protein
VDVLVDCLCPGTPHDQDTITLSDELDFRTAARIRNSVSLLSDEERQDEALVYAVLQEAYLLVGVSAWTVQDADGKPVPVGTTTVRNWLLPKPVQASIVADAADDLYTEAVMAPLVRRAQVSSQPTPTGPSTSAPNGSAAAAPAQPTPLKRSSTSTTRTGGTAAASA